MLTLFRIFLVPLLVVVLLTEVPDKEYWGLGIFLLAALTDALDGIIARRTKTITTTGAMLDPIADKLLMSAAFISLVELQQVPAWMVTLIVGREFAVTALRMIALERGIAISANWLGKAKTTSQIITVSILIFSLNSDRWHLVAGIALWITVALTIASMVVYFWQNRGVRAGGPGMSKGLLPRQLPLHLVRFGRLHPRLIAGFAVLAWVLAGVLATRVQVETDILSLVPRNNPVVEGFKKTVERFGSVDTLLVVIHIDPERPIDESLDYADRLAGSLRNWDFIDWVEYRVDQTAEAAVPLLDRATLFLEPEELDEVLAGLDDEGLEADRGPAARSDSWHLRAWSPKTSCASTRWGCCREFWAK